MVAMATVCSWNQSLTHLAIAIPRSISQFLGVLALMDMSLVRAASTVSIGISRVGAAPGCLGGEKSMWCQ